MRIKRLIALLLAAVMLLASLTALTSCVDPVEPDDGVIKYKVNVTDSFGNPMSGIIVNIFLDDEFIEMKMTDKNGVASSSEEGIPDGSYTVEIVDPLGTVYDYDTEAAVLSPEREEITVALYTSTDNLPTETVYPSHLDNGVNAIVMPKGGYRVKLSPGRNYFIFYPELRGKYTVEADTPVESTIGYYGSPHFVQSADVALNEGEGDVYRTEEGLVFLIRSFNIGEDYFSSTRYVFAVDVESECTANIVIGYDEELEMSKEEMPWSDVKITGTPTKYVLPGTENWDPDAEDAGSTKPVIPLTNLDLTDENITIVYNSDDKCYHLGDADGPVVLVRLASASEYIASFSEMMETAHFGIYVYEGDKLKEKRDYTNLLSKYVAASDAAYGLYPLNDDLIDAIKTIGDAWGWYKVGSPTNLFGDKATKIVEEYAHLFACCYISE
ncbi:MAG: hypothetical protein IKC87_01755 [Clostridia bacterium]|nr:hypothetical protein [Clostridia bacterium]